MVSFYEFLWVFVTFCKSFVNHGSLWHVMMLCLDKMSLWKFAEKLTETSLSNIVTCHGKFLRVSVDFCDFL